MLHLLVECTYDFFDNIILICYYQQSSWGCDWHKGDTMSITKIKMYEEIARRSARREAFLRLPTEERSDLAVEHIKSLPINDKSLSALFDALVVKLQEARIENFGIVPPEQLIPAIKELRRILF